MAAGGVVATVLDSTRTERNGAKVLDVKSDPGGGANVTLEQFGPAGDDSRPLPGDALGGVPVQGSGRGIVSGYADPKNAGVAEPGEVRRYSRDSDGELQAAFHLRDDGSIEIMSAAGGSTIKFGTDGSVTVANAHGSFTLGSIGGFSATTPGAVLNVGALGNFSVLNLFGNISMGLSGDVDINGATITSAGEVINAAGKVLGLHGHLPGTYLDSLSGAVTGVAGLPT